MNETQAQFEALMDLTKVEWEQDGNVFVWDVADRGGYIVSKVKSGSLLGWIWRFEVADRTGGLGYEDESTEIYGNVARAMAAAIQHAVEWRAAEIREAEAWDKAYAEGEQT